jgi:hypothetical protein
MRVRGRGLIFDVASSLVTLSINLRVSSHGSTHTREQDARDRCAATVRAAGGAVLLATALVTDEAIARVLGSSSGARALCIVRRMPSVCSPSTSTCRESSSSALNTRWCESPLGSGGPERGRSAERVSRKGARARMDGEDDADSSGDGMASLLPKRPLTVVAGGSSADALQRCRCRQHAEIEIGRIARDGVVDDAPCDARQYQGE